MIFQTNMKKDNDTRKKNNLTKVISILLILIIIVCGFGVAKITIKYYKDQQTYKELSEYAKEKSINWEKLHKINPDVIAWVKIKDTNIDYPIVSAPDNDKYLHTKFNGEYGEAGTLFADAKTVSPFEQFNTIIYGHHMRDGSMFNNLKKFKERDFFDSHKTFELFTPKQNYTVNILSFYDDYAYSEIYKTVFSSQGEKNKYIQYLNDNVHLLYQNDKVKANDKIILLSTCAYEFEDARYVLVGRLVPQKIK